KYLNSGGRGHMKAHIPAKPRQLSPTLPGSPVAAADGAKPLSDDYTIAVRDILLSLGMKLAGSPLQIRKNQRIIEEGRAAEHFFVVLSGLARTFRLLPDGRRQITRFVFP